MTVNVNTATVAELEALRGVGPVLAHHIAQERIRNGPFVDASDLLSRISEIGPKSLDALEAEGLTIG